MINILLESDCRKCNINSMLELCIYYLDQIWDLCCLNPGGTSSGHLSMWKNLTIYATSHQHLNVDSCTIKPSQYLDDSRVSESLTLLYFLVT